MTTFPYTPGQVQRLSSGQVNKNGEALSPATCCDRELDVTKRDRFELLSAYLDGEVTPDERQQVLCWLQNSDDTRCLYNRLLSLRQGMRTQSCPPVCDAEDTLVGVFRSLNHRLKLVTMAGAGVLAIGAINLLSGGTVPSYGAWRVATVAPPETLQIALDQPAFPIPEAAAVVDTDQALEQGVLPIDSEL
ncbi:zf-HC2 domain-containing protein [Nodosilinea sp. LEGE 07088]|uniref:anti-sigma factor family protein n=1 Tax=Nodosilinea sp. LEGE 07088 TaxID=2777968 RepID=UPI00188183C9|nr:zf-HC2 domain-containing protein [Nodosilinea sp. LEGE 07088]MBE9136085.1 zf-HC2 domain-containing protein [Nodosilinea sp. LEGE 07088]